MTFSINSKMINDGESSFFSLDWLKTIEDHLSYLKNLSSTISINIENNIALRFEFDLSNLLLYYNYPYKYHYVILRINNMKSFTDYRKEMTTLIIPSGNSIDNLFRIFKTYYRKIS